MNDDDDDDDEMVNNCPLNTHIHTGMGVGYATLLLKWGRHTYDFCEFTANKWGSLQISTQDFNYVAFHHIISAGPGPLISN